MLFGSQHLLQIFAYISLISRNIIHHLQNYLNLIKSLMVDKTFIMDFHLLAHNSKHLNKTNTWRRIEE